MGTNSHGLRYEETKKPWGSTGSPMAPFYYKGRLMGMDEPCRKRSKSGKRGFVIASYALMSKLWILYLTYFFEMSREPLSLIFYGKNKWSDHNSSPEREDYATQEVGDFLLKGWIERENLKITLTGRK